MIHLLKYFCFAIYCFAIVTAHAQYSGKIPAQSPITLVYKITDKEAGKLYSGNNKSIKEKILPTCIDTLQGITEKLPNHYPNGHYLLVNAESNNLNFRLISVVSFEHRMLNNQRDMSLVLFDRETGQPISSAKVKVDNKKLKFDKQTQSYRRAKTDKQGILSIESEGITAYYTISRQYNLNSWKRTKYAVVSAPVVKYVTIPVVFVASIPFDTFKSLQYGYPVGSIRGIVKPFKDIYNSISWGYPQGWIENFVEMFDAKDYDNGFIIFSKPKYQPSDTIRFKAYITKGKKKPMKDSLNIYIYSDKEHKIGTIAPYRAGFYTMDFVPKADWGMKLDKTYRLRLADKKTRQYGNFYYEDYELKSVEYHIRNEKEEYLSHEEVIFYAKATDENNMPVMDARLEITLHSDFINDFSSNRVDVPNLLWFKQLTLDPVGETKIIVPDSIWHDASLKVKMVANFSNSDNQTGHKEYRFVRKNSNERIVANQNVDTLHIHYEKLGIPVNGLQAKIKRGLLADTTIVLPARIKLNPLVENYDISLLQPPNISETDKYKPVPNIVFSLSEQNSGVLCSMNRTDDTIFISIDNPLNLPLIYTIYKGNKERERGTGKLPIYKDKSPKKDYFLSVQYIWGGKEHQLEYRSAYSTGQLQLNSSLQAVVFPGQTVNVNIIATDANGKPIPNVDLTVYGYTAKFGEQRMPNIQSYQKPPTNRKSYNAFTSKKHQNINRNKELDYDKWQKNLKLDDNELYKFAYPDKNMYSYSLKSTDNQTYIAPYLVHKGKLLPIQILYIDDRPVYFARTTTHFPYMFPVTKGVHSIRMRSNNFEVKVRIFAYNGCKNIFSIDPYNWDKQTEETKGSTLNNNKKYTYNETKIIKKNEYTDNEINLMRNYLMTIRYLPLSDFTFIQHGNNYELLTPEKEIKANTSKFDNRHINHYENRYEYMLRYGNNYANNMYGNRIFITGPISSSTPVTLWDENRNIGTFQRHGFQWYEYEPFTLKNQSKNIKYYLDNKMPDLDWTALPYSKQYLDKLYDVWKFNRTRNNIYYTIQTKQPKTGQLQIETTLDDSLMDDGWCWVLYDHTSKISDFYPLTDRKFATDKGLYSLFLLMADKTFYILDSISLETNVTTLLRLPIEDMKYSKRTIDSYGKEFSSLLHDIYIKAGMDVIVPVYQQYVEQPVVYNPDYYNEITVCGKITDASDDTPVPGVSINVKGTTVGAVTDLDGYYCIRIPKGYRTLRFSFIGFTNQERTPLFDGNVDVSMETDLKMLDEVVVTGMARFEKRLSIGVTDRIEGRSAGVSVTDGIYGTANKMQVIDAQDIMKQLIEDEIYQTGLASAKGLRTNFSDEALWQPSLTTDKNGIASFTTTFPDDVTKWNIRFVGFLPNKVSAANQIEVRSFKPLMGQLAVPRFLVEGDTANVIGKIVNYGQDTVHLKTEFAINGVIKIDKYEKVRHSLIDTLAVVAPDIYLNNKKDDSTNVVTNNYENAESIKATDENEFFSQDSIAVRYQLTRDDGYQDGEERHIPIFLRGTNETIGQFHLLDNDTTLFLSFNEFEGPVKLSFESSSLEILLKETRTLRNYKHLCNEQTASRLIALLLERKVFHLYGKEYPYDKHIRSLIEQLIKGRNENGLWGWFGNNVQETWISTHALEALLQAIDDGFKVEMDFENITNRLIINFDNSDSIDRIKILGLLMRINPESNYRNLFDKISIPQLYNADLFRWMELSILFGEKPDIEKVMKQKKTDKIGNIFWIESDNNHWRYNDITVTLAAYRLLRSLGDQEQNLRKIRNYLFTQRSQVGWRNTYETTGILSTILPDLLILGDNLGNSRIRINNKETASLVIAIDTFPKQFVLHDNEPILIDKKGLFPVYLTASQDVYQREPEPANNGFRVETRFGVETWRQTTNPYNNLPVTMTAGKPVTLEVNVYSDISSEYVVIEIPIPAGCSYQSKPQSWYRGVGETHREYFRDRVCIYLRNLPKGEHTFSVELMPRYTGTYNVNPAKVERMYNPLYNGKTGMKAVKIVD